MTVSVGKLQRRTYKSLASHNQRGCFFQHADAEKEEKKKKKKIRSIHLFHSGEHLHGTAAYRDKEEPFEITKSIWKNSRG